jgi:hypothetical protein
MAGSWSPHILNRYLAPGISAFTQAQIPTIDPEGEEVEHWMANHFLNSVFRGEYAGKHRQLAFNIIYRAQACFEAYQSAADTTHKFLLESDPGKPKSRIYYKALRSWEMCFLHLQTFVDLINRSTGKQVFAKDDGSPEQRAYAVANVVKHWGQMIARDEHDESDTVPMWLANDGFHTRTEQVTYQELAGLLKEVAAVAESLRDPTARENPDA